MKKPTYDGLMSIGISLIIVAYFVFITYQIHVNVEKNQKETSTIIFLNVCQEWL